MCITGELHVTPARDSLPRALTAHVHRALPVARRRSKLLVGEYRFEVQIERESRHPHAPARGIGSAPRTVPAIEDLDFDVTVREGERHTAGVSLATNLAFAAGVSLWLVYGVLIGSWPVIAANVVTLGFVLAIIGLKLRYG